MNTRIMTALCGVVASLAPIISASAETKVGVILPLSGEFARYGEQVRKGLESKTPENVALVYDDEGCNAAKAVTVYQKLTAVDGVSLLLGPWCGSPQTAVASLLKNSNRLAVLGSSAPRRVFELSGGRMFSTQHSIEEESAFNAREAHRLGARRVVILFFENDFSRAHEAAFRENFEGEVLETLAYTASDASTLRGLALRIKTLAPDTLYVPDAFPLMHGLMKILRSSGLGSLRVFSVYSAESSDVLDAVGAAGEGMFLSYPRIAGAATNHFGSLAAEVLAKGIASCREVTTDCVRDEIRKHYRFDEFGVMEGTIGLKVLRAGKFVWNESTDAAPRS